LSKYNLNIALIDKDLYIADDVSFVNKAILYDGSECKDNLMIYLENMGNMMLQEITKKLNVPNNMVGHLTIDDNDEKDRI
ncbi:FAD/NAD(P)-binding oxidoreductase, partial [Clostridium perfringens]